MCTPGADEGQNQASDPVQPELGASMLVPRPKPGRPARATSTLAAEPSLHLASFALIIIMSDNFSLGKT